MLVLKEIFPQGVTSFRSSLSAPGIRLGAKVNAAPEDTYLMQDSLVPRPDMGCTKAHGSRQFGWEPQPFTLPLLFQFDTIPASAAQEGRKYAI